MTAKYETSSNNEPVETDVRVRGQYVRMGVFPVEVGVDIIRIKEYLAPKVKYANVPDVRILALLCRSVICTWHVHWIVFVHVVFDRARVIMVMNVAGGI